MPLIWNAAIDAEVKRLVGRGVKVAASHLAKRIKQTLSVPAPRRRVQSKAGTYYYRATTKATPGAPPRKLSGRLRASIAYEVDADGVTARVGTNVFYASIHERGKRGSGGGYAGGKHPFLRHTLERVKHEVEAILGYEIKIDSVKWEPAVVS